MSSFSFYIYQQADDFQAKKQKEQILEREQKISDLQVCFEYKQIMKLFLM